MNLDKNKVVIGMSGGVDSTVAAYLLKHEGYEVIGVTFNLFNNKKIINDAKKIANNIGVELYDIDLKDDFKMNVIDYFIKSYLEGQTPNPCVECNKHIKFNALLKIAEDFGAYYIATGHYANICYDDNINKYIIKKSKAEKKDQTYMLYNLTQKQLKHIKMPLGKMDSKDEVRNIANNIGLENANKPDSQEICFIPDDDYVKYIKSTIKQTIKKGHFVDKQGNILGTHSGIINYTIGQRKGLGIAFGKPMYVVDIDFNNNQVILGESEDIFKKELISIKNNFIHIDLNNKDMKVQAQIRYNAKPSNAIINCIGNDKIKVKFEEAQRAITHGQSVVFYDNDILIGGGIIL